MSDTNRAIKFLMPGLMAIFLVSGCGAAGSSSSSSSNSSNDSTTSKTIVTGNVAKGTVSSSNVNFYALNSDGTKGDKLASAVTGSDGGFQVEWDVNSNPVLAEASGGSYTNEATLATDTLLGTDKLTAVYGPFDAGYAQATITPLTHMAATRALVLLAAGLPLATSIDASNVGVAQQYNLTDIWQTLPADANNSFQVQVAVRAQREYGLVLAGIAEESKTLDVRPIDLSFGLATDMEDGTLDGLGSNPIPIPTITGPVVNLPPTAGLKDLQKAILTFVMSGNDVTQLAGTRISTEPVIINPAGGTFYINATALPAWIENQGGTATLTATGGTPPYTWSITPGSTLPSWLTLNANGTLTGTPPILAPGSTRSMTPPFSITCTDSKGLSQAINWSATIVRASPSLGWLHFQNPQLSASFDQQIAQGSGGSGPYYCKLDTMGGFPPLGMVLTPDCHLKGKPSSEGFTKFRVCVVDMVGASNCGDVGVTVGGSNNNNGGNTNPGSSNSNNCTCYCGWPADQVCKHNSDCPDDTSMPGTDVPGVCGCPVGC